MIKASELRIGNLVENKGAHVCILGIEGNTDCFTNGDLSVFGTVRCTGDIEEMQKEVFIQEISPIPLTKLWLEKFGFTASAEYDNGNPLYVWAGLRIDIESGSVNLFKDEATFYFSIGIAENVKYVHQFQNLFFALTGGELNIKQNIAV